MTFDYQKLKKHYDNTGYFICKNVFSPKFVSILIEEINNSKNTKKYYDKSNILRRIEKLYNKGVFLKKSNEIILKIINNIFSKDFTIFKDKFNAKPPGGEGFYAHYDGIFQFKDNKNVLRNGWYEYGNIFINALIALDKCDRLNGSIELANAHEGNFDELLMKTLNDGTPAISKKIESKTKFSLINLEIGDVVFFSNTCPHRSGVNKSKNYRRILYYTYTLANNGSAYDLYFDDKEKSKNLAKALNDK